MTLDNWSNFHGYGIVPGITEATHAETTLPANAPLQPGARIRVKNTDGSVHHEEIHIYVPGRRYSLRVEPPNNLLVSSIMEEVELEPVGTGCRMVRRFTLIPRFRALLPLVALLSHLMMRRAVERHNRVVMAALTHR
jgi:hypothetical protein